ncbi:solute carrier family 2, facilitated glucose transporter member 5-like [Clavelina lepadiformis]|uniref:Major facilitator superfamily (MFS) profile domain-containing protein n=1 Tax=Clavelina lepadiformis TaxID=159417 RepID=A0ABP0FK38_CLALP
MAESEADQENQKLTALLVAAVAISVLGSSFQYGYNIAVVNAPAKLIQSYFFDLDEISNTTAEPLTLVSVYNTSHGVNGPTDYPLNPATVGVEKVNEENEEQELTDSQLFLWSFTVSIYTVGGMVGSFSTGFCVKKMGRKGTLLASNSLSIVGAILMGTSKVADSLEMIIVARFLLGILAGLATGVVPLYIGEISPKRIRGGVGVVHQLSITVGLLTAQVLSLNEILGTEQLWPLLLAFTGVPSIIQLCVLPFLPESPRSLLIDKSNELKAREALTKFRGTRDVSNEIREMRREADAEKQTQQLSAWKVLKNKPVRWQLISVVFLQVVQQLCGINAIFFYLNRILEDAGVPASMQNYASVGVGSVNVVMTIISVFLMDAAGRKILLAGGYAIAAVFCALMTASLNLKDEISWMSYLSIASVIGFIIGFAIGPGPVPWILTTEFFRQSTRPAASAIGSGLNWTFNFTLALIFPFMQKAMGPYVFLFFLAVCVVATVYIIMVVPETKNKTFQEINLMFAKRNKIKNANLDMNGEDDPLPL